MTLLMCTMFVALVTSGLLAGTFFAHRTGTSLALPTIPESSFVQFQQVVHRSYVRFMPILQILAILSSLAWLYLLRNSTNGVAFALVALAVVGTIVVFAITLTVNVPINKKLMTWNASTPPSNVREIWKPWDKGNTARTVIALIVFVLMVLAVTLPA